jgi:hypothetical protein
MHALLPSVYLSKCCPLCSTRSQASLLRRWLHGAAGGGAAAPNQAARCAPGAGGAQRARAPVSVTNAQPSGGTGRGARLAHVVRDEREGRPVLGHRLEAGGRERGQRGRRVRRQHRPQLVVAHRQRRLRAARAG